MKKHTIISVAIIITMVTIPLVTYAASLTSSFGGKVLLTQIPDVTCYSSGTGPVVLFSNIMSVVSSATSEATGKGSTFAKVSTAASGIYNSIPLYTEDETKTPQTNGWILGRADIVPSFDTCYIQVGPYQIPFPVKTTDNYNVSSGNSL